MANDTTVMIVIDGMKYPLDLADFSGKEVGILKQHVGIRGAAEIQAAM